MYCILVYFYYIHVLILKLVFFVMFIAIQNIHFNWCVQSGQKRKKDNAGTAKTPKKQNIDDEDDLEDDYDLEDPFIDDGSEDEYEPDNLSDESDSEWNDSQAVDDGEDTKRLVKEAKRFTKNAKKD